ncbi:septum formation family protein [Kutzneria sp. NPDC052558]|uniref:septum formation family protein n=1 Tax=Kutzneria sp. NPDC052558 TaxID=3364121 RepID=UPI0037C5557F
MSSESEQPTPEVQPAQPKARHYIKPVVIGVVFVAAMATLFVVRLDRENHKAVPNVGYTLQPGQCFDRQDTDAAVPVTAKDCADAHSAEVFAVEPLSGSSYPGQSTINALGHRKCPAEVAKALAPGMNYSGVKMTFLYPVEDSWAQGDRAVKCYFQRADGLPMSGHVKDTGLPYTPEQKHYLDTVSAYDAIVAEQDPAAGWAAEKAVVARSIPVVQKEIDDLKAGPWPNEFAGTIDQLIAAKQAELADRQRAAADTDQAHFSHYLDDATHDSGSAQDRTVRATLGIGPR